MKKLTKKTLALLFAVLLLVSVFAGCNKTTEEPAATEDVAAGDTVDPTVEPTEEPVEEPTEEPAEEPVEEPTEEPVDASIDAPEEVPAEAPVEAPVDAPAEEPAAPAAAGLSIADIAAKYETYAYMSTDTEYLFANVIDAATFATVDALPEADLKADLAAAGYTEKPVAVIFDAAFAASYDLSVLSATEYGYLTSDYGFYAIAIKK
jgi:outer membrane biosynthesis protein TonB